LTVDGGDDGDADGDAADGDASATPVALVARFAASCFHDVSSVARHALDRASSPGRGARAGATVVGAGAGAGVGAGAGAASTRSFAWMRTTVGAKKLRLRGARDRSRCVIPNIRCAPFNFASSREIA